MFSNNGPDVPKVEESYLLPPNPNVTDPGIGKAAI
jgi:hypothetical protein